jgi:hypothetical protein
VDKITAIRDFKEFNRKLRESNLNEFKFVFQHREYDSMSSALCEYDRHERIKNNEHKNCKCCPIVEQYGKRCEKLGFDALKRPRSKWFEYVEGLKEE